MTTICQVLYQVYTHDILLVIKTTCWISLISPQNWVTERVGNLKSHSPEGAELEFEPGCWVQSLCSFHHTQHASAVSFVISPVLFSQRDTEDADFAFISSQPWTQSWKSVWGYRGLMLKREKHLFDCWVHRSLGRVDASSETLRSERTSVSRSTVDVNRAGASLSAGWGFVFAVLYF